MARKTAARGRRSEHEVTESSLSLDVGRVVVERRTGGGHGATCRAQDGGEVRRRWRWVARATQRGEEAVDGRGVRHDRAHRHASCAPGAARDVHVEGAAQEGGPIHAGKRRVERAARESVPVRDGEDVRGHLQRRPRHEERRRRHRRSARNERRLARSTLRGRPQPRPLDARGNGGGGTWLGSRRCHRARAPRRRTAADPRRSKPRDPHRPPRASRLRARSSSRVARRRPRKRSSPRSVTS